MIPSVSNVVGLQNAFQVQNPQPTPALDPVQPQIADTISLQPHFPMPDSEAAQVFSFVEQGLMTETEEALSVHGGLDLSRVMSLLEE